MYNFIGGLWNNTVGDVKCEMGSISQAWKLMKFSMMSYWDVYISTIFFTKDFRDWRVQVSFRHISHTNQRSLANKWTLHARPDVKKIIRTRLATHDHGCGASIESHLLRAAWLEKKHPFLLFGTEISTPTSGLPIRNSQMMLLMVQKSPSQPPGMYKTLYIMGYLLYQLDWLAGFLPPTVSFLTSGAFWIGIASSSADGSVIHRWQTSIWTSTFQAFLCCFFCKHD